jgi:hypothetical protein
MRSVFSALSSDARREQRLAYRQFLAVRDGAMDVERRTLSHREAKMRHFLKPSPSPRPLDRTLFDAQYSEFDRRRETPQEALLLLALVKINAAESYAVSRLIEPMKERFRKQSDDMELLLTIEEDYHTKILLSASTLYGLTLDAPYHPRTSLRALIGILANVPLELSRPLVLLSELLGTLQFIDLLRIAGEILRDLPEVRDAVEERLTDVIVDEIGHVSFNRLCLGPAGLAQARVLFPMVAAGLADATPELRALGVTLTSVDSPLHARTDLPDHIRRQAFFA